MIKWLLIGIGIIFVIIFLLTINGRSKPPDDIYPLY